MSMDDQGNEIPDRFFMTDFHLVDKLPIPGSIDNGEIDTEHSPIFYTDKSERVICAADQRHADHEARIAALELQVHRLLNAEPDMGPSSDTTWRRGFEDGKAFERSQARAPEGNYADIPAVTEWETLRGELEALRGFKASVPWEAVKTCLWHMPNGAPFAPFKTLDMWRKTNAPKEATE